MGIGLRKLALVGAALLAGGLAVAGDALAQGGPTTAPLGHGARPPGVRPPVVRPPVVRPPITNPGFPSRPPGHWQRPPHGGHWGHRPPHYRPPMVRPRPHCVIRHRLVPSPYGLVRRPVRVCY